MKADPNNLIKLKALYQTLFCISSTKWTVGSRILPNWPATGIPIKALKLWGDNFLCCFPAVKTAPVHLSDIIQHMLWASSYCYLVLRKASHRTGYNTWVVTVLFHYNAMNESRDDSDPSSTLQTHHFIGTRSWDYGVHIKHWLLVLGKGLPLKTWFTYSIAK